MKVVLILITSFMFLKGCSSSENVTNKENMQVISATFKQWSDPPSPGSDIPERGTDLTITVQNWPEEFSPKSIVFNNRKSLSTVISDSMSDKVVITGRVIRMSGLLKEKSERVNLSDRLMFVNAEGETDFIEITNWKRDK